MRSARSCERKRGPRSDRDAVRCERAKRQSFSQVISQVYRTQIQVEILGGEVEKMRHPPDRNRSTVCPQFDRRSFEPVFSRSQRAFHSRLSTFLRVAGGKEVAGEIAARCRDESAPHRLRERTSISRSDNNTRELEGCTSTARPPKPSLKF